MSAPDADLLHPLLHGQRQAHPSSLATNIAAGIALLYFLHQALLYFDYPVPSPRGLVWNALVFLLPKHLLLDRGRRQELLANGMLSQTHAAKSEALRRALGVGGQAILQKLPAEGFMRRASSFGASLQPAKVESNAPAGLGNWDNSCYQNSVLQGLASLDSLKPYLEVAEGKVPPGTDSTRESLLETINKLNDPHNNGKQLWTPGKLKNMSSWQQQDAQEYYSKIMDELDKEATKSAVAAKAPTGLERIINEPMSALDAVQLPSLKDEEMNLRTQNPVDGLLAQRVTCTRCGYSEGLSMIPFNCLTLPLGSDYSYTLHDCLNEYTKLEDIPDVECAKCTLLRAERQLEKMLPSPPNILRVDTTAPVDSKTLTLPPELRAQAFQRLAAIQHALEADDFVDKTLNETCSIPKKARVSSTKTRQAAVGRAPRSLVVHVNRSVFDEKTGVQRKNYASLRFPAVLDLSPWIVNLECEDDQKSKETDVSMLEGGGTSIMGGDGVRNALKYTIKAVVTHYGRHENGHYICYRRHPVSPGRNDLPATDTVDYEPEDDDPHTASDSSSDTRKEQFRWWRLSDEDVSAVSEAEVLAQNGVFMLFYEREHDAPPFPGSTTNGTCALGATAATATEPNGLRKHTAVPVQDLSADIALQKCNTRETGASATVSFSCPTPFVSSPPIAHSLVDSMVDNTTDSRATESLTAPSSAPSIGELSQVRGPSDSDATVSSSQETSTRPTSGTAPSAMRTASNTQFSNSGDHGQGGGFASRVSRAVVAT